jgi:DNA-binding beta-propeller fold protein YncE
MKWQEVSAGRNFKRCLAAGNRCREYTKSPDASSDGAFPTIELKLDLMRNFFGAIAVCLLFLSPELTAQEAGGGLRRYLYVAEPGIRNYLEYGGHGVVVLDIDADYKFVKRIPFQGLAPDGKPANVKGICGNPTTNRLFVSTIYQLICIDLSTDTVLWERAYPKGCDRMSMSPDGKIIYLPSFEKDNWYVVNAADGEVIKEIEPKSKAHNTVFGIDGKKVYLAGLGSPVLSIAETDQHTIMGTCGPFSQSVRPFTVNGSQARCFVNVNGLLGFEIGDLVTGQKLARVEVSGFQQGPVKRHGCPSHGIGMTPDEREVWLADAYNKQVHVFDVSSLPPKQVASIPLREEPGWITFSIDGKTCWPSTGEVIEVASRKVTRALSDETGRMLMREKMLEVQWQDNDVVAVGDQFGRGMKKP